MCQVYPSRYLPNDLKLKRKNVKKSEGFSLEEIPRRLEIFMKVVFYEYYKSECK